jgi:hypothetical protein
VSGPVAAAEQAAESLRTVNHLTLAAPASGTPGWEDVGDLYRVLGELRVLAERLPQSCGQLARHLECPAAGHAYGVDDMADEPASVVVVSAVLALDEAQRCASRTGQHLNDAMSAVAHLHA